jgi:hypothetical protein
MDGKDPEVPHSKPKGDTVFGGVSLLTSCAMIVIPFFVWAAKPVPTSPPGNDYPIPSNSYVFTVYGTDQAFTLSGGENIVLATYSKTNQDQIFRCDSVPSTNRLGFVNTPSNRRILRNRWEDVRARPHGNPSVWESFAFEPLQGGGFRMTSLIGKVSSALRLVKENGKRSLRLCYFFFLANIVMWLGQPTWFTINPHRANSQEFVVGVTKVA